jgi:hypothetical protein
MTDALLPQVPPATKLFLLRIFKGSQGFGDNAHFLSMELDRGWRLASYEVVLADPQGTTCDVLVVLNNGENVTAVPPANSRLPGNTPPEKLFVLRTHNAGPDSKGNAVELWRELDRGWTIDSYEVVFRSPTTAACYILVKLKNVAKVPAAAPRPSKPAASS